MFWHPNTKARPPTPSRRFPVPPGKEGMDVRERLEIEVKLLLSADRKIYMPRRLSQQRMILSDLEWPFPHRALSLR